MTRLICPYKTPSASLCTHKQIGNAHVRKKYCPYKNVSKCHWYKEWLKLKKSSHNAPESLRELFEVEDEA